MVYYGRRNGARRLRHSEARHLLQLRLKSYRVSTGYCSMSDNQVTVSHPYDQDFILVT